MSSLHGFLHLADVSITWDLRFIYFLNTKASTRLIDHASRTTDIIFNNTEGLIKGSKECGIEQISTVGNKIALQLADGAIDIAGSFVEFVWRHPVNSPARLWKDFYTDFIPENANHVIESLYAKQ